MQLREGMGLATYNAMIDPLLPLSKKNHTLTLILQDKHHQDWIQQRIICKPGYLNLFRGFFNDINLKIKTVLMEELWQKDIVLLVTFTEYTDII